MQPKFPIELTESGSYYSMTVTLNYHDGKKVTTNCLTQEHLTGPFDMYPKANGYFSDGGEKVRVTNIVGYDGQYLLKWCPHCEKIKPIIKFDQTGRMTDRYRDQSNCAVCRGNY